jgi:hypothetical protein
VKVYWVYNGDLYDNEPEADEEGLFSQVVGAEVADALADALERAVRRGEESGHLVPIQDVALVAEYRRASPEQARQHRGGTMTFDDAKRYDELLMEERDCLDKAHEAIRNNSPVGAREWFEAAETVRRLAKLIKQKEPLSV